MCENSKSNNSIIKRVGVTVLVGRIDIGVRTAEGVSPFAKRGGILVNQALTVPSQALGTVQANWINTTGSNHTPAYPYRLLL